jgi:pimeloyl-ACP methyl ester carboxylesterase
MSPSDRPANRERNGFTAALSLSVLAVCASATPSGAATQAPPAPTTGLHAAQFTEYSPLAATSELVRRMLSPLAGEAVSRNMARRREALNERAVDLARETFAVYAPRISPPRGYGVLVFVPPWPDARLPPEWALVLDRFGMIFVSAAGSGNDASVVGRRAPLAVLAAANVAMRYRIDPDRVFVGGFSGGSRVALRLALDYPDVFHGAFLNAGSDAIGGPSMPLPSPDLFARFQKTSRLFLATGDEDPISLLLDAGTVSALHKLCVSNVKDITIARTGHAIAAPDVLATGLAYLTGPASDDEAAGACRQAVARQVADGVEATERALAGTDHNAARKAVLALDRRFGGLVGAEIVGMADRCGCELFHEAAITPDKTPQ